MNVFCGTLMLSVIFSSGVSNIRHGGQDSPEEDSNPTHWTMIENVNECINSELLTVI